MKSNSAIVRIVLISVITTVAGIQYGCSDVTTAPVRPAPHDVSTIVNAPGDSGAPELIFLAPLGPKLHPHGILDTTLAPSVTICRLQGERCGTDTVARFSSDSLTDSTNRVGLSERAYFVQWKVKQLPADTSIAYRVIVALGDTTVGFTDVKIVDSSYVPSAQDTVRFGFITERNRLRLRFQIFVPAVTLTVVAEPGVQGDLGNQTYTFRRGERVQYAFAVDSGYRNALVTLDQNPIPKRGRITMDDSHVLVASADRYAIVLPQDDWILREARALLNASNKVAAAQRLLTRLDTMQDTTGFADRLRQVEMSVLQRDADVAAMPALDAALAGHSFDAGSGDGSADDTHTGGGGGGGGATASALLIPTGSRSVRLPGPSTAMNAPSPSGAEPVTIAYVNGILTTPLGALFAAHHVAVAAREAHWNSNVPFDVKLMYNRSALANSATAEDRCILAIGIEGDWLGLNSLPGEVAKCLNTTEPSALALFADFSEAGLELMSVLNRSMTTRPPDVDSIAAFTTKLRDDGRHVVFVMHSQGNLVVQQALTLLRTRGKYNQSHDTTCIGGVALASPTSQGWPIPTRHLHGLAVDGDAILMLGNNKFPRVRTPLSDSAAHATSGSFRTRIAALSSAANIRWGIRLHSLVESYLDQEPMRTSIENAIVSSYRGCALGTISVSPQVLSLRTGDHGSFTANLVDLDGAPLDGSRGLEWKAETQTDWQRGVQLTASGEATAKYVGGTSVSASTRSIVATAGAAVNPANLTLSVKETLSAIWAPVFIDIGDQTPIPPFVIPSTSWGGGSCAEHNEFESNGRKGTFSKQCTAAYVVNVSPFAGADKYTATFFETNSTAPSFSVSSRTATLHGSTAGPSANLDLLPGPVPMDRISISAFDPAGHLLASGNGCVRGCAGWSFGQ
jgi:hypothetical protein